MAVTRTHFRFRIDVWTANGERIVGHVAGIEDYETRSRHFPPRCERWPRVPITLRHGARAIEDSRRLRLTGRLTPFAGDFVGKKGLDKQGVEKM